MVRKPFLSINKKPTHMSGLFISFRRNNRIIIDMKLAPSIITSYRASSDFDNLRKPINQYSKYGDLIATFDSLKSASMATGIQESSISYCCRGRYKSAGGFKWSFN